MKLDALHIEQDFQPGQGSEVEKNTMASCHFMLEDVLEIYFAMVRDRECVEELDNSNSFLLLSKVSA